MKLLNLILTPDWETEAFPEAECVNPEEREPTVLLSVKKYACIVVDTRFPDSLEVVTAVPYVCPAPAENGGLLWGWSKPDGQQTWDHHERAVHEDSARVVAWTRA